MLSPRRRPARRALGAAAAALALCSCAQNVPQTSPPTVSAQPQAPADTQSAAAGSPTASRSPAVRWENDPAVKALRLHYLGSAKGVNAQTMNIPELRESSTAQRFSRLASIWEPEYGYRYPGPIPFTPLAVTAPSTAVRQVALCVLAEGWLRDPATGLPTEARKVERGTATVLRQGSTWRVDSIRGADGSCDGVPIPEVQFS